MDENMADLEKWRGQMRKGFLELCVLALLESRGTAYGLDLMEGLGQAGVEVGEGTLYPLLARMTREESLSSEWETPEKGHPRKYYRLTQAGRTALEAMKESYEADFRAFETLVAGASGRAT